MAQIEQLTAELERRSAPWRNFSLGAPVLEHMDELRHSVGYDDDAIREATGQSEMHDLRMLIGWYAEREASTLTEQGRKEILDKRGAFGPLAAPGFGCGPLRALPRRVRRAVCPCRRAASFHSAS